MTPDQDRLNAIEARLAQLEASVKLLHVQTGTKEIRMRSASIADRPVYLLEDDGR